MSTEVTLEPLTRLRAIWANPQLRYPILMLTYLLIGGSLFTMALSGAPEAILELDRITAITVQIFLSVFTDLSTQHNTIVTLDGFAVSIIIECVGLLEMVIYSACVLAFPAPIRAKFWGVPFGCLAIFGFNVVRIATLLVVGRHWNQYFDFFHIYFWQATLIAMIVGVLFAWIKLFVRR